jgi:hypothetical protein
MANSTDRPPDDGNIGLPSVDAGMNRVTPSAVRPKDQKSPVALKQDKKAARDKDEEILRRARKRFDLSVGIALGSASQIALFVAPVLVLLSYLIGPTPIDLHFWPGAVVMVLVATLTATLVMNGGRSAWFVGVLALMVYMIFAMTLYLLPPRIQ